MTDREADREQAGRPTGASPPRSPPKAPTTPPASPKAPRKAEPLFPDGERRVTLAAVVGAHGIGGEVRLKLFCESVDSLKAHTSFDAGDRTLTLKSAKHGSNGAIARFAEIADRSAAEALRGTELTVPRSALPPLGEGEYYYADLLGLSAFTPAGEPLGTVVAVENFGAGDIVEIERPDGKRFMVPMRHEAVPEWDANRLIVDAAFAA